LAHEYLLYAGHHAAGVPAQFPDIQGYLTPAQKIQTFVLDNSLYQLFAFNLGFSLGRQKDYPGSVFPGTRQSNSRGGAHSLEELVGQLNEDARAVASLRVTPTSAPVP
jgi:hypothetical protein